MEMDYTKEGLEKFDGYLEKIREEISEMKIPENERKKLYSLVDETAQRDFEIMECEADAYWLNVFSKSYFRNKNS